MGILRIAQDLLQYLKEKGEKQRTCDAVEESIKMLRQDLPKEERKIQIKRIGDTLTYLSQKEKEQNKESDAENKKKKMFLDRLHSQLDACQEQCNLMVEKKIAEQNITVEGFESDFRVRMNAELNSKKLENREALRQLILGSQKELERNIQKEISDFTKNVNEEIGYCMENIRKDFGETQVAEYYTSYVEMDNTIMVNYDTMQRSIMMQAENYQYPREVFQQFIEKATTKLHKVALKGHLFLNLFRLLPIFLYIIKYIFDHYIIPPEQTPTDKLLAFLSNLPQLISDLVCLIGNPDPKVVEMIQRVGDKIVELIDVVTSFIDTLGAVAKPLVEISFEFILLGLFIGWLYLLYCIVVKVIWKKFYTMEQQKVILPMTEDFFSEVNIKENVKLRLEEIRKIAWETHLKKHKILFDKISEKVVSKDDADLQRIYQEYQNYIESGEL